MDPLLYNLDAAQDVRRRRWDEAASGSNLWRPISGPLPDLAWDAFFGAIQRKGNQVRNAGGKMNVDLIGRRGTSGIGTFRTQALDGLTRALR